MKILPFAAAAPTEWDKVIDQSGEAWLFHRHAWVELEARFAAQGNFSFALQDDQGRVIGICPLYRRDLDRGWLERILDTGYHRHTGLALVDDLPPQARTTVIRTAMRHLFAEAQRLDVDRIQMNAQNLAPAVRSSRQWEAPFWVQEYGFELGMHLGPCGALAVPGAATLFADQVIHLEPPVDQLFANLESSCQRAIRKAERSGLTFVAQVADPVATYYELAQVSAQRTGEQLLPREYYQSVWERFGAAGRAVMLFALHQGTPAAALVLLIDKQAASYLAGVSHHDYLSLRVNDFLHWQAVGWCRAQGIQHYRLGPTFPELPEGWPVSKVSRFKGKFGARSYTTIQGSYFCKPRKYLDDTLRVAREHCLARIEQVEQERDTARAKNANPVRDLAVILRRYGFAGIRPQPGEQELTETLGFWWPGCSSPLEQRTEDVRVVLQPEAGPLALGVQCHAEPGGASLREQGRRSFLRRQTTVYRALLPHVSFTGPHVQPLWVNAHGRAVLAWLHTGKRQILLIGLNLAEEIVRYTQGDPEQANQTIDRTRFNFTFERANYLFDGNLTPGQATVPWADRLGFAVVRLLAQATGLPLLGPLPRGARGAVLLTGDDDQAALSCYRQQLDLVGDFPITYFLLPVTKHTRATLAALSPTVEFGLHVDALEQPDRYEEICTEQCRVVRELTGAPVRAIRNHGFLNRGYLGHLGAWETNGLQLDVNYAGLDGTALNGSFLPGYVRRPAGTWSSHLSLLTAFGDGMRYISQWTEQQAIHKIHQVAAQIEQVDPGILVFNMHPENIDDTRQIHQAILNLGRRPGWTALGVESYLRWLEAWNKVVVTRDGGRLVLQAPQQIENLMLQTPARQGWQAATLAWCHGEQELSSTCQAA